jgi:hypothetical protein
MEFSLALVSENAWALRIGLLTSEALRTSQNWLARMDLLFEGAQAFPSDWSANAIQSPYIHKGSQFV